MDKKIENLMDTGDSVMDHREQGFRKIGCPSLEIPIIRLLVYGAGAYPPLSTSPWPNTALEPYTIRL